MQILGVMSSTPSFRGIVSFDYGNPSDKRAYFCNGDPQYNVTGNIGFASSLRVQTVVGKTFVDIPAGNCHLLQFHISTTASNLGQQFFPDFSRGGTHGAKGYIEFSFPDRSTRLYSVLDGFAVFEPTNNELIVVLTTSLPRIG